MLTTNVDTSNPRRLTMEYVLEWHLLYRNGQDMLRLAPGEASKEDCRVLSDLTGVNLYLEVRKPRHAT